MSFTLLFTNSIKNLLANKVRAVLTMLGVVIGVFSVIVLVAIGSGIESFITGQFNALGSNLVLIAPGQVDFGDDPAKAFSRNKLDDKHIKLIDTYASDVVAYRTPSVRVGRDVKYKTKKYYSTVIGGNETALNLFNYEIDEGRFFSKQEVRSDAKVIVLGFDVKKELFGDQSALGQRVSVGDDTYEVIGTFKSKGRSLDQNTVSPYTSIMKTFNVKNFSSIGTKLKEGVETEFGMKTIELALLRDLDEDEFTVLSQADILSSIQNILRILTAGIGAIAGISLVVGGIGIMNIMLVSVTERIREIGLRKALGATPRNIALQFMMEAILVSLLGGIIGLLLGWGGSLIARNFVTTTIPAWAVFMALGFSILVGIIFGTYPAIQASKKDPIEALRYE